MIPEEIFDGIAMLIRGTVILCLIMLPFAIWGAWSFLKWAAGFIEIRTTLPEETMQLLEPLLYVTS